MNPPAILRAGAVIAAFVALWYVVGSVAGILWTRRALLVAGFLAVLGAAGFWIPWGPDVMLLADVALIALIWLDATLAQRVVVARDPLPALSVGHAGEVTYRWTNPSKRRARLYIREVRPDILGGVQPTRTLRIPPRSVGREPVAVVPLRRGRESRGGGSGRLCRGHHRPARTRPPPYARVAPLGSRCLSAARFGSSARVSR